MEEILSGKYGAAGICVLLTIMVLLKVGELLYSVQKEKVSASEKAVNELAQAVRENTVQLKVLENRIQHVESGFADFPKIKRDLNRIFTAVKMVAKEEWTEIRKEIMNDGGFNS